MSVVIGSGGGGIGAGGATGLTGAAGVCGLGFEPQAVATIESPMAASCSRARMGIMRGAPARTSGDDTDHTAVRA